MGEYVLKPSELKLLLQCDGIDNYKWKGFLRGGYFPKLLLENTTNSRDVVGKIVSSPSEGELEHWPKLRQSNLNRLLDTVHLEHGVKIFISNAVGKSIGDMIHDNNFIQHPLCFDRKKRFVKGILLGLDYLHHNSMSLLNLSDLNVAVCSFTDKAIICDFSCTVAKKSMPKMLMPSNVRFKPPEIHNAKDDAIINCFSIDMWSCGVLSLQIFTQHLLPWLEIVENSLECLDMEILRKANTGSKLLPNATADLKKFLQKLLAPDPSLRFTAEEAYKSHFLHIQSRLDDRARNFWKSCEVSKPRQPSVNKSTFSKNAKNTKDLKMGSSSTSELDVVTVLADKRLHANSDHNVVDQCTDESGSTVTLKAKSEPGSTVYATNRDPYVRQCISFPYLRRGCSDLSVGTTEESDSLSCDDEPEASVSLDDYIQYRDLKDSCRAKIEEPLSKNRGEEFPYDTFLTEWEADISVNKMNVPSKSRYFDEEISDLANVGPLSSSQEEILREIHRKLDRNLPLKYSESFGLEGSGGHSSECLGNHYSESDILRCKRVNEGEFSNYARRSKCNSFCSPPHWNFDGGPVVDANSLQNLQNYIAQLSECDAFKLKNMSRTEEVGEINPSSKSDSCFDFSRIIDSSEYVHSRDGISGQQEDRVSESKRHKVVKKTNKKKHTVHDESSRSKLVSSDELAAGKDLTSFSRQELEEVHPSSEFARCPLDVSRIKDSLEYLYLQELSRAQKDHHLPLFKKCLNHKQAKNKNKTHTKHTVCHKSEGRSQFFADDALATGNDNIACSRRDDRPSQRSPESLEKRGEKRWFHSLCLCRQRKKD